MFSSGCLQTFSERVCYYNNNTHLTMKKNVGKLDKMIRLLAALLMAVLVITGLVKGAVAVILVIAAVILLVTSLTGFCGLYTLLGMSTCPVKSKSE